MDFRSFIGWRDPSAASLTVADEPIAAAEQPKPSSVGPLAAVGSSSLFPRARVKSVKRERAQWAHKARDASD